MTDSVIDRWAGELERELGTDLTPELAGAIAAEAARIASAATVLTAGSAAAAGAGSSIAVPGTVAGLSTTVKVMAATTAAALGLAAAGVTDSLPDPIQSWVADVAGQVGVELPRPDRLPAATLPSEELPTPDLPLELPTPDIPDLTVPDSLLVPGSDGAAAPGD